MSQLNTKGYTLSIAPESTIKELALFYKTQPICRWDIHHFHPDQLSVYKTVKLIQIQTFEDVNYLKGIIFTYLCDGWITVVKTHFPEITIKTKNKYKQKIIEFKDDQYIKNVEWWRSTFIQKAIFTRSDGFQLIAGSETGGKCDVIF